MNIYDEAIERADRWHRYFLRLAEATASLSKDPSTRVGAVLVRDDNTIVSTGFNGFPRGMRDTVGRLAGREERLSRTVHAERNAILAAAKHGSPTRGASLYMVWYDAASGERRGGPPCSQCVLELAQAGIKHIYIYNGEVPERWERDMVASREFLDEIGIALTELDQPEPRLRHE